MSNFRNLIETILIEYDRDDPTDNFWAAAKDTKRELKKNTLYTKTINPVKDTDPVYVKLIVRDENSNLVNELWLTKNNPLHKTYDKNKATTFPSIKAEEWVKRHPKEIKTDPSGKKYELHYEIEKA